MSRILIIKDISQPSCNKFIHCTPFYTINCIDQNIIPEIIQSKQLLITSRNGVIALMVNIEAFSNIERFKDKEIVIVGSKTYTLLEKNGFSNLIGPYYDIQSLIASGKLYNPLYLSGFHTSFVDYKSYNIERKIVYKATARAIPFEIIKQVIDGNVSNILLYSRRGAHIVLESFPKDYDFPGINFICISHIVAEIVAKYNPKYPVIPIENEMFSLIN
jgi:uroporphyrinogen-III synthase